MKYNLSAIEEKGINEGNILTIACYNPNHASIAELIVKRNKIKYKIEQSESPTGKDIFIFFMWPDTYYKAFRVGDMANCPELYKDDLVDIIPTWELAFSLASSKVSTFDLLNGKE